MIAETEHVDNDTVMTSKDIFTAPLVYDRIEIRSLIIYNNHLISVFEPTRLQKRLPSICINTNKHSPYT